MNSYRFQITIFICQIIFFGNTYGQSNPPNLSNINPPSPNATSLAQFGNYPVTYFNGLIDISVPVYDIKTPRLELPIKISYHSSGIKVTDVASWVGLGWGLDCGGEITRQVNGLADEKSPGYLSSGNIIEPVNGINLQNSQNDISYIQNLLNGTYDGQPDLFSYICPAGSGSFLFQKDKKSLIRIPQDKNTILDSINQNKFIVIDESGNSYVFGKSVISGNSYVETSQTYTGTTSPLNSTAWMLTEIISADKSDTITFKYYSSYSNSYEDAYEYLTVSDEHTNTSGCPDLYSNNYGYDTEKAGLSYSQNEEFKLSEIDYKNGKVIFTRANSVRQDRVGDTSLSKITVYNFNFSTNAFQSVKVFNLFQSYFNNGDRLKLDSVQINGTGITVPQTYKFLYNPLNLPARGGVQEDYWGYYNNNSGTTLLPKQNVIYSLNNGTKDTTLIIGDANRNSDTTRVKADILKAIYYPSGGFSQFIFQSNQFSVNDSIVFGGGVRISEILTYDGISPSPQRIFFKYPIGIFNGSPLLFSNYYTYSNTIYQYNYPTCWGREPVFYPPETIRQRTISSNPNFNFTPIDGSVVFYPSVSVFRGDSTGLYGHTTYDYDEYSDQLINVIQQTNIYYDETFPWRKGHLISKTEFDKNGNPVFSEVNSYVLADFVTYDSLDIEAYQNIFYAGPPYFSNTPQDLNIESGQLYFYGGFKIQTATELLASTIYTTYDQQDRSKFYSKSTIYNYDEANYLPSNITTVNSQGQTEITNLTYAPDFTVTGTPNTSAALGIQNLQKNYITGAVVEKYVQRKNSDGSNLRTTNGIFTTYKSNAPNPDTIFEQESFLPILNYAPVSITSTGVTKDPSYVPLISFSQYDTHNNILQQLKINGSPKAYEWGYNYTLPVAIVDNAFQSDIAYSSFEDYTSQGNWVFPNYITTDATSPMGNHCYSLEAPITKSGLNSAKTYILSYWLKSGSYLTITAGTQSNAVTGVTLNGWTYYEINFTGTSSVSISGGGEIDELRLYPNNAQMTTYTYYPGVGIWSSCSPNNLITYYQYDGLGRLQAVSDENGNIIKTIDYNYSIQ